MRFSATGPSIPHELLIARDEDRVVFFCGAGVSRAFAKLPDFFELATDVVERLGLSSDSPVRKIIEEAREISNRTGESGLISADRLFGILERQFEVRDIHAAVARSLAFDSNVDLTAHRTLLRLAKGSDGRTRLVTTNFDQLFERCDGSLRQWYPPSLPNLDLGEAIDGVVHLHGLVNSDGTGPEGTTFVLSSSEFGRAYLAQGWATEFIRAALERYLVVFVGYSADDPPVQYLLEALSGDSKARANIYAFQAGNDDSERSKWLQKGAIPITYSAENGHQALWQTLDTWSFRAQNTESWYDEVVELARRGPRELMPHERGQVAHIVSTIEGARRFSRGENPPPAEWLCVFDPHVRYSPPGHHSSHDGIGPFVDPFEYYGLDSDPVPKKVGPDDHSVRREVPSEAWNCFSLTKRDKQGLGLNNIPAVRGYFGTNVPQLSARFLDLGNWIAKVSKQPAAVWWAASQGGLHSFVCDRVRHEMYQDKSNASLEIAKAWHYLFEAWGSRSINAHHGWFQLKEGVAHTGWSNYATRRIAEILAPRFDARRPFGAPLPPSSNRENYYDQVISVDVKYPEIHEPLNVPDNVLASVIAELRKNLENAVTMEKELSGYELTSLVSITEDEEGHGEPARRSYGIAIPFLEFARLFRKLIAVSIDEAKREFDAWREDDSVFSRLRIWACGEPAFLSDQMVTEEILGLSDRMFWGGSHQRDLLLVLAARWANLAKEKRKSIEKRLLSGPTKFPDEEEERFAERRAWIILNRIHWLSSRDCELSFDLEKTTSELKPSAPRWRAQAATKAAESMEGRSGFVKTDKKFGALVTTPVAEVLTKAKELSGRHDDFLVENDPFAGLSEERPTKALLTLRLAASRSDYPEWAWQTFLHPDTRKKDRPRLTLVIAERISRMPRSAVVKNAHSITEWLSKSSGVLQRQFPVKFHKLWNLLVQSFREDPDSAKTTIVRGDRSPEWAMEALNSPIGKMAQMVMDDPRKDNLKAGQGFPREWLDRVDELLRLPGDLRRHSLTMFAFNLSWFYTIDPDWTERQMLPVLLGNGEDQSATWAGVFWSARIPPKNLYIRLKPSLVQHAKTSLDSLSKKGYVEVLTGFILHGWGGDDESGERVITNGELRDLLVASNEDFRLRMLWQLEKWSKDSPHWQGQVLPFLREVWPRQKAIKSPRISVRLCDLAIANKTIFAEIVAEVLPLITQAAGEYLMFSDLSEKDGLIETFPSEALALLYAVLPLDITTWPHRIEEVLDRIGGTMPALVSDFRLVELKRRWGAR